MKTKEAKHNPKQKSDPPIVVSGSLISNQRKIRHYPRSRPQIPATTSTSKCWDRERDTTSAVGPFSLKLQRSFVTPKFLSPRFCLTSPPWLSSSQKFSVSAPFIVLMPSPLQSNEIAIAMKLELQSASNFLVHLVRLGRANLSETQLERFQTAVIEVLQRRYRDHWFPEKPYKGSGYRWAFHSFWSSLITFLRSSTKEQNSRSEQKWKRGIVIKMRFTIKTTT